jgi:hypothetical protein
MQHLELSRARARERQRRRRTGRRRIDYFPSENALEVIDSLRSPYTPASGPIIDKIIREWGANRPDACRLQGPDPAGMPPARDEPRAAPPPPPASPPAGSYAAWGEAARAATTRTGSRYPAHWEPGQLLNVRQFTDGSRVVCLLHEDPERAETETLTFDNASDAQEFVAWWYAPAAARDDRYQPGSPPRSGRAGFAPPRSQGAV